MTNHELGIQVIIIAISAGLIVVYIALIGTLLSKIRNDMLSLFAQVCAIMLPILIVGICLL